MACANPACSTERAGKVIAYWVMCLFLCGQPVPDGDQVSHTAPPREAYFRLHPLDGFNPIPDAQGEPEVVEANWTCPYQTGHQLPVKLMLPPSA